MNKPDDLNQAQWEAVTCEAGHVLVVAGPGTGKTHTLARRIARTVPKLQAREKLLAITFTNKAAEQLKSRLMALGVPQRQMYVGTFHSFCLKLLRDHWSKTPLPKDFKIALEDDLGSFDKKILDRIGFLKSTRLAIDPDQGYKDYQRYLREHGLIDFDDVLREALDLLEDEEVAVEIAGQYRHIFIDEYQDINIIQHALLKKLAQRTGALFAIGDPHQSIYGFRGSDVRLFNCFKEDYPDAEVLRLYENYRSPVNLLTASHQVIEKSNHDTKVLLAKIYKQGHLKVHEAQTDRSEADYVASQIEKMLGGTDMRSAFRTERSFGDIAVLYRLNAERHCITQALDHLGIPHQCSGKSLKEQEYSDDSALGQHEDVLDYHIEKVSLLSLHAAKGLEFPVVFIIGCEEHLLPLDVEGMSVDKEEERRLFYVGMTRAKEELFLTYAKRRQLFGKTYQNNPSPFLSDIKEELKAYEAGKKRKERAKEIDDGQLSLF